MGAEPVRVLIVDEWAVAAEQLRRDLAGAAGVEVVGVARTADQAARLAAAARADVAVVDVGLRGGTAAVGVPVVAVCTAERPALSAALYAIEGGAVDVWVRGSDLRLLVRRLTAAVNADRLDLAAVGRRASGSIAGCLLAIAAGVGGTASVGTVLAGLPADAAGVVVTSLPAEAVGLWAERTARRCRSIVAVATGVHPIVPGRVWVAAGDRHLTVQPTLGGGLVAVVRDGPSFAGNRPSLDVLLSSVASCGGRVVAAVLGGVGTDGVNGLRAVRDAGGRTAVESPGSACCGELPASALHYGAAERDAAAESLAAVLVSMAGDQRGHRAA